MLIPGFEVACAIGRGTSWGARPIIQEVGCGKNDRNNTFFNALSAGTLVSVTQTGASSMPVFLLSCSFDDVINAFRTECMGCFSNGFFADGPQDLRLRHCHEDVLLNANQLRFPGSPFFITQDLPSMLTRRNRNVLHMIRNFALIYFTYFGCSPLLHGS